MQYKSILQQLKIMYIFVGVLTNVILPSGIVGGNAVCHCSNRLLFIHFQAV